jgi:asparaginyl-tRNA synthetase
MNTPIFIKGWIRTLRSQKDVSFINVNDGSNLKGLQIVIATQILNDQHKIIGTGVSIGAKGILKQNPVKHEEFELHVESTDNFIVYGENIGMYPIPKTKLELAFLRTMPDKRIRTNTFGAIARIRHHLAMATHDFYGKLHQFILVAPPQITQNDCEGGGESFQVTTLLKSQDNQLNKIPIDKSSKIDYSKDFFGAPSYLTVSGQLQLETYCLALGGVYCYQSAFRADPSQTSRHVAEFTMLEVEIPHADLNDNMDIAEEYIKFCIQVVTQRCPDDIKFLDEFYYQKRSPKDKIKTTLVEYLNSIIETPFTRMNYDDIMKVLLDAQKSGHYFDVKVPETGIFDLKAEHERYLTDIVVKKPVFVMRYPAEIKAFYMKPSIDVNSLGIKTVECCDLLVPGIGEVLGGSCRNADFKSLVSTMEIRGLLHKKIQIDEDVYEKSDLDYYVDLRRYGSIEHAGFGIGMSRLLMMLTGMDNIRDMIEFPRTIGSINF